MGGKLYRPGRPVAPKGFKAVFGENAEPDDWKVMYRLRCKAIAVLHASMTGRRIDPLAQRAAEFILAKTQFKEEKGPTLHLHISPQKIEALKAKAGLIGEPVKQFDNAKEDQTPAKDEEGSAGDDLVQDNALDLVDVDEGPVLEVRASSSEDK